ncbi:MAG: Amuc_1100 family pilus-like protein [Candidatus Omnitrophica bacterium]|nr:Amuc_1100 family pilus-like protein [Candidatus Omnitrophota bacterium]
MLLIKRNLFSILVILALLAVAIFFAVLFGIYLAKDMKISGEITAKSAKIDTFVQRSKMSLTEDSVTFLEDERNKLKSAYSRLKLALTSPISDGASQENIDSLQFKEKLIQTQKKLREEAKDFSLALPASLGFTKYETELSDPAEIPSLLKRMKTLEELVYLMTLSGIVSLDEINFIGEDVKKAEPAARAAAPRMKRPPILPMAENLPPGGPLEQAMPMEEEMPVPAAVEAVKTKTPKSITISFKITCTYPKLADFLYKLKVSPFIFVVTDLDITKAKDAVDKDVVAESMLQASFLVRAEIIN